MPASNLSDRPDDAQSILTLAAHADARLRGAETLLMRAAVMLTEWERRYGDARPRPYWLSPGQSCKLAGDIEAFLADPGATFGPYVSVEDARRIASSIEKSSLSNRPRGYGDGR